MDEEDKVDWDDGSEKEEEQTVFTFCKSCNNAMRPQADSMTKVSRSRPVISLSPAPNTALTLCALEPAIYLRLR